MNGLESPGFNRGEDVKVLRYAKPVCQQQQRSSSTTTSTRRYVD